VFVGDLDEERGFAAIVSNPPFQGDKMIPGALGPDYREYLVKYVARGKRGRSDLCVYFFLRADQLVRHGGQSGLLATNTIAQGDTREAGLEQMETTGWRIPRAVSSRKWPGMATLEVAIVWLRKGDWKGPYFLDEKLVEGITSLLTVQGIVQGKTHVLVANTDKSFRGSMVLGMGFVLEPKEAFALIEKNKLNKDVLFPYLNGEDLNTHPNQSPSRWIINFYDWSLERAEIYHDCMKVVRERVKPERDLLGLKSDASAKGYAKLWWQYGRKGIDLYSTISSMKQVLTVAFTSRTCAFSFVPNDIVFSNAVVIFAFDKDCYLAILQSSIHLEWAFMYGSSLKSDLRYTPTDEARN
jgi:hypothetical protein